MMPWVTLSSQAERVAHGQHDLADADVVGVVELRRPSSLSASLVTRMTARSSGLNSPTSLAGSVAPSGSSTSTDFASAEHVRVRDDVALVVVDDARAGRVVRADLDDRRQHGPDHCFVTVLELRPTPLWWLELVSRSVALLHADRGVATVSTREARQQPGTQA